MSARANGLTAACMAVASLVVGCDYDDSIGPHGDCDELAATFTDDVLVPILQQRCIVCHRAGGLAAHTDLVLVAGDDEAAVSADLAVAAAVAKKKVDGESVLLLRPTGRHPSGHTGGALIDVDSDEYAALAAFAQTAAVCATPAPQAPTSGVDCTTLAGPRLLRRLSRDEWAQSVKDLLDVDVSPSALAPDDVVDGFDNQAAALEVSPLLADQLRGEAERVAREAVTNHSGKLALECDLATGGDACATAFIRTMALRAFRRPPSDAEVAAYLGLFDEVRAEDGASEAAIWTLAAMLQSPSFLYRSELGVRASDGSFTLTGWELATALAYLTTGAPPDEALLRHAAADDLDDPTVMASELARLLADPRADATLARFGERWLGIDRLPIVTRDASTYPELTPEVRADMAGEAARFLVGIASSGGTVSDLLTSRTGYMTDRLADYYGLPRPTGPADDAGFRAVDLTGTEYGGVLRLGAVLTTHALPQSSSPIHRGKMVREKLLCEDLPPPPSNLDTSPPPMDPTKSTRERYAEHASDQKCADCHSRIDQIGFGLEHFDGIGRWRDDDGGHPIDDSGVVTSLGGAGHDDASFTGPDELAERLEASGAVDRCWLVQRMRHGLGYDPATCLVDDVSARHVALGGALEATLTALVGAPAFAHRHGDAGEGDTLAVGAWDFDDPPDDPVDPTDPTDPTHPTGPVGPTKVDVMETTRWETGYCLQIVVTNTGGAASGWAVERSIEGTLDNVWSAVATPVAGTDRQRFTGLDWNATLAPGADTTFGFCASMH